jgi:hypothetical protein
VELKNSDGSQISTTGHFSASYAYTASYALTAGGVAGSTPGGSSGQLQFNNAGTFGGTNSISTTYQFTGSLAVSGSITHTGSLNIKGSITGSNDTVVNLSNLGNGTAGKLVIPTQVPSLPVHGTMYMSAPGVGNVTLYIYNESASAFRSVTLT